MSAIGRADRDRRHGERVVAVHLTPSTPDTVEQRPHALDWLFRLTGKILAVRLDLLDVGIGRDLLR